MNMFPDSTPPKDESEYAYREFTYQELSETLLDLSNMAVVIVTSTGKILYCSRSMEHILGMSSDDICEQGWPVLFSQIYPDDRRVLLKEMLPLLRRMLREVAVHDRSAIAFNYTCRMKNSREEYVHVAIENKPLVWHQNKRFPSVYVAVFKNISPYAGQSVVMTTLRKRKLNQWHNIVEKEFPVRSACFTRRETEIIRLVADGLNSAKIAEKLFISANTVRLHRKRILKKSECHSSTELIQFSMAKKII